MSFDIGAQRKVVLVLLILEFVDVEVNCYT